MKENGWRSLVNAYETYAYLLSGFLGLSHEERVATIDNALSGQDKVAAVAILPFLPVDDKVALLGRLLNLAAESHGLSASIQKEILRLPREWLLLNIEQFVEPILRVATYDEYRRMLELYSQLDDTMTAKLAVRAANHHDEDIQEAGEDFLAKLSSADK